MDHGKEVTKLLDSKINEWSKVSKGISFKTQSIMLLCSPMFKIFLFLLLLYLISFSFLSFIYIFHNFKFSLPQWGLWINHKRCSRKRYSNMPHISLHLLPLLSSLDSFSSGVFESVPSSSQRFDLFWTKHIFTKRNPRSPMSLF
jgi:hypothetical protein